MTMTTRLRTLLVLITTLALAFAPLRGALAIPAFSATDSDSHCADMMQDMTTADSAATRLQTDNQDNTTEDCCNQCDGSCVDCAHSTAAISNTVSLLPDSHNTAQTSPLLIRIPPGNFSPPYRPPVSI